MIKNEKYTYLHLGATHYVASVIKCPSTIAQVLRKMNLKFWMSRFFMCYSALNLGLFQLLKIILNCLFKNSYFTDVPAVISFQIKQLTLKFT